MLDSLMTLLLLSADDCGNIGKMYEFDRRLMGARRQRSYIDQSRTPIALGTTRVDALAFLDGKKPGPLEPIYVVAGEEAFLKRLAQAKIRTLALGDQDDEFGRTVYDGESAEWAAVHDELETLPFASPRRLIVVQTADPFITHYRDKLEKYVGQPSRTNILVLDVKSWKSNTRLAKMLADTATIQCVAPGQLADWCGRWSAGHHGKRLEPGAARMLVDLVGDDMGVLDQEIAKLAAYVGEKAQIAAPDVDLLVAHSRLQNTFQMLDTAAEGNLGKALAILDQLFAQGDEPMKILGGIVWQLTRAARVERLCRRGASLAQAVGQAGFPPFKQDKVQQQLRRLGPRARELYDWLLATDLALKSTAGLPPRLVLERLLVRLAGK